MWDYLEEFKNFQCIFIDLPGHGASDFDPSLELTMDSVATSVQELVRKIGITSYDVVGHSMGGYVALELKKADVACDKIVLLNSNFWSDSEQKKMDRKRVAELVQTKKDVFVQTAVPNLFMNPRKRASEVEALIAEASLISSETIAQSSIAMSERIDNTDFVKENSDAVLIIQGEHDSIVQCDAMEDRIKGLDIALNILESGHMAHIELGVSVKEIIEEFIAKKNGNC
jgi:pimeloyl-ACP methyl ester carboxylesterase